MGDGAVICGGPVNITRDLPTRAPSPRISQPRMEGWSGMSMRGYNGVGVVFVRGESENLGEGVRFT